MNNKTRNETRYAFLEKSGGRQINVDTAYRPDTSWNRAREPKVETIEAFDDRANVT